MKNSILFLLLFLLFFSGSNKQLVMGYRPVYVSEDVAKTISYESPRELKNQGKIYVKDNYIFIGDIGLGVHVIDNSNPEAPQKMGFLKIYGNHDIAIKGSSLYADNYSDLVTIDISNMSQPIVTKRIEAIYDYSQSNYPPNVPYGTYFECVDPSKGFVVDWLEVELESPKCYTTY